MRRDIFFEALQAGEKTRLVANFGGAVVIGMAAGPIRKNDGAGADAANDTGVVLRPWS